MLQLLDPVPLEVAFAEVKRSYHVVPFLGGWKLCRSGAARAVKRFRLKAEAVKFARGYCRVRGRSLFIHKRDGTICEYRHYG